MEKLYPISIEEENINKSHECLIIQSKTLEEKLLPLLKNLSTIKDKQTMEDLEKIRSSLARFVTLCDSIDQEKLHQLMQDRELLREVRHDFRASLGAVIEYCELIQDTLEDQGLVEEYKDILHQVCEHTFSVLLYIEAFRIDNPSKGFFESDDNHDLYTIDVTTGKILIVDDNPERINLLRRKIENMGHQVYTSLTGKHALQLLRQQALDLILIDLMMPGINGYDVLKIIKSDNALNHIPVLVISSSADMENIIKCLHAGAVDYLPTPINKTLLSTRINSCLAKKFSRDRESQALRELNEAKNLLTAALESTADGFAIFDPDDKLVSSNNSFKAFYPHITDKNSKGMTFEAFLRSNIKHKIYQSAPPFNSQVSKAFTTPKRIEDWIKRRLDYHHNLNKPYIEHLQDGRWIEVVDKKLPDGSTVVIHKDISEGKEKQKRLEYLAHHDPLTGLANRQYFNQFLNNVHITASKNKQGYGLIFFDIDNFKQINDNHGHIFGDYLLQSVSQALLSSTRHSQDLVARLGGDEFAAIITNDPSLQELTEIAHRCLASGRTHVEKDGLEAQWGLSIGIARYPDHGTTQEGLIEKSDKAMYEAKRSGKNSFKIAS
jgi:diguanylate cyclase (GGDEF)-like protein